MNKKLERLIDRFAQIEREKDEKYRKQREQEESERQMRYEEAKFVTCNGMNPNEYAKLHNIEQQELNPKYKDDNPDWRLRVPIIKRMVK